MNRFLYLIITLLLPVFAQAGSYSFATANANRGSASSLANANFGSVLGILPNTPYKIGESNSSNGSKRTSDNIAKNKHALDSPPTYEMCTGNTFDLDVSASVLSGETVQWYKDGVAISGATNGLYTATTIGVYSVIITNGSCSRNGCTDITIVAGTCGSIGNYVWNDANRNGTNDEPASAGINGVTVELWKETSVGGGVYAFFKTTTTANNAGDASTRTRA